MFFTSNWHQPLLEGRYFCVNVVKYLGIKVIEKISPDIYERRGGILNTFYKQQDVRK
jgi:hypothetical protein